MQNTNQLADAVRAEILDLTMITDVEAICHSEFNVVITLTDEAGDARVFQVKALSPWEYSLSETCPRGETYYNVFGTRAEVGNYIAYSCMV